MPKRKKTETLPDVYLVCGWHDCRVQFLLDDFLDFRSHIEEHISDILPGYRERCCNEKVPDDFVCMWTHCGFDTPEDANELIRHLLFHAFHTKLKAQGARKQLAQNLSECSLDFQGQNMIPDVNKPFFCEWEHCELEFNCPYWFYQHVDSHVMAVEKQKNEDSGTSFVACGWKGCKVQVKNHYKLKEHCRTHTHERVYACSVCGGMFASMSKLIDHLTRQNQTEYQSFQCSHCLKHCGSQRILRDHMRHHVNQIKCELCDMTCPNPSSLKQHMKFRHSDDRPYQCDLCDASWKTLSDLRRHRDSHSSVLNYKCSVEGCDFSARAVQTLKRHFKVEHQGEELANYECHLCATRYTRGTGLTQHLKTKHNFRWPSGHPRFRYKQYEDGVWRLQTVRFESLQLSQQFDKEEEEEEAVQEEPSTEDDESTQDSFCENHHYQNTNSSSELPHLSQNTLNIQSNECCSLQSNSSETIGSMELSSRSHYSTVKSTDNVDTTYNNTNETLSRSSFFHTIDGPAVASLGGSYYTECTLPQTMNNTVVKHNTRYDSGGTNTENSEQASTHQFKETKKKKRRLNPYEKPYSK